MAIVGAGLAVSSHLLQEAGQAGTAALPMLVAAQGFHAAEVLRLGGWYRLEAKSGKSAETEGEKVNKTKMKRWHRMKSQKIKERKQDLSGEREENKEKLKPKQFRMTGMKRVTGG